MPTYVWAGRKAQGRKYYAANRELLLAKANEYSKGYYQDHKDAARLRNKTRSWKEPPENQRKRACRLREEVFAAYGGKCTCCGEANFGFLTVDHIDGGGNAHKRSLSAPSTLYRWLRQHEFPQEGFQLLCYNCNLAKSSWMLGTDCPHSELERPQASSKTQAVRRRRIEALQALGGVCECCGLGELPFLAFDHIDGSTVKTRQAKTSDQVVSFLRKNDFPLSVVRVLCHNCNCGRQLNGGVCPHVDQ